MKYEIEIRDSVREIIECVEGFKGVDEVVDFIAEYLEEGVAFDVYETRRRGRDYLFTVGG